VDNEQGSGESDREHRVADRIKNPNAYYAREKLFRLVRKTVAEQYVSNGKAPQQEDFYETVSTRVFPDYRIRTMPVNFSLRISGVDRKSREQRTCLKFVCRNGVTEKLSSTCNGWKPIADFSPGGKSQQNGSERRVHCECRACNSGRIDEICQRQSYTRSVEEDGAIIRPMAKQDLRNLNKPRMRDLRREYATHEKSLARKLVCVYRNPHTDEPSLLDVTNSRMKKSERCNEASLTERGNLPSGKFSGSK